MVASDHVDLEELYCECCFVLGWWMRRKRRHFVLKHDCGLIVVKGVERLLHQRVLCLLAVMNLTLVAIVVREKDPVFLDALRRGLFLLPLVPASLVVSC